MVHQLLFAFNLHFSAATCKKGLCGFCFFFFCFRLVVEILLSSGMDVNIKTSGGTALHEAALCGKLDVVRTLLDAGVDLGLRDAKQNTVLDLLRQFPKHVTQDIFTTIKSECYDSE